MNGYTTGTAAVLRQVLWMLAPAITLVVASEFVVVGLLPPVSAELGISLAEAGHLTGLFALSAAVLGPGLTLLVTRWPPSRVLVLTLLVFAVGNAVMACAHNFTALLIARITQGAMLPAFISVGAAVVTTLALPEHRGRALANANIGFVLGVLLALPMGVVLAEWGNWRWPFLVLSIAQAAAAAIMWSRFPIGNSAAALGVLEQLRLLRSSSFLGHLLLSVILFASMFAAYTFLGAWLDLSLGLSGGHLAIALFLFSAAGLLGNNLAAQVADRAPLVATVAAATALGASINFAQVYPNLLPAVVVLLCIWSVAHTAGVTLSQVRVALAGHCAPAFAMTMNISCANLGIAIGAFSGGWVIDHYELAAIGWAPLAFAAVAVALCIVLARAGSRSEGVECT